jgi:hypothetical protein
MLLIRLQQRPMFGFLLNPFCTKARAMELESDQRLARLARTLNVLRLVKTQIIAKESP